MVNNSDKSAGVFDFYSPKKEDVVKILEDAQNDSESKTTFSNNNKLKILIVDADVKTINLLSSSLKRSYDVYCTKNLIEALKLSTQHKIALVISDQAVPNAGMTGVEFMDRVKKLSPSTSRILLANPIDFGNAKIALKPGDVFRLFKKPFNPSRLLEVIDEATMAYLEQSGSLAIAAERLQKHAPNINKEIKITPSISASANGVIIKCANESLFEEIKANFSGTAHFLYAKDKEAAIQILENTITKAIIYCFEHTNILDESETRFISQIKTELPHLAIIALLNKEKTNYQDIMSLINKNIIYSYLPSTAKTEKICQQLNAAIALASKLYTSPILLKWPPAEKLDVSKSQDKETLSDKLSEASSKLTDKLKTGFLSIKNLLDRKNNK